MGEGGASSLKSNTVGTFFTVEIPATIFFSRSLFPRMMPECSY